MCWSGRLRTFPIVQHTTIPCTYVNAQTRHRTPFVVCIQVWKDGLSLRVRVVSSESSERTVVHCHGFLSIAIPVDVELLPFYYASEWIMQMRDLLHRRLGAHMRGLGGQQQHRQRMDCVMECPRAHEGTYIITDGNDIGGDNTGQHESRAAELGPGSVSVRLGLASAADEA